MLLPALACLTPEKRSPAKGFTSCSARADRPRPIDSRLESHAPQSYVELWPTRASARRRSAGSRMCEQTPESHAFVKFLLCLVTRMALTNARVVVACYKPRTGRTDMPSGRPAKKLRTAATAARWRACGSADSLARVYAVYVHVSCPSAARRQSCYGTLHVA